MSWESPKTEMLIDYLAYYQQWQPSYIRQIMLPMLSTIFLRKVALNSTNDLLYGQYEFDSVQRVKIRYGCQFYVVKWKKASNAMHMVPSEGSDIQAERGEHDESSDLLDEPDAPHVHVEDGCLYLSTDEHMELVWAAFPEKVKKFLQEKEVEEQKSRWKRIGIRSEQTPEKSESTKVKSVQLNITEFYRSSKIRCQAKPTENVAKSSESNSGSFKGKRTECSPNLSKSARRRLLLARAFAPMSSLSCFRHKSEQTPEKSESTTVKSVQLNITEFYRSSKIRCQAKPTENVAKSSESNSGSSKGKRTECSPNLSKSARRRLLFS
ncbi:hypothetical protein RJ639_022706 [Escallonia herrerae]|uniref:Uncharacterized protein n=1 Tax=Escallonia herrerae TaxID=1293975 RepID=A0AA89ACG5_9ASTE|nr:hypothetical protein RJ639_022706 [Escallonia herrerae]